MVGNFEACHKSQIIFNFLNQKTILGFLGHRQRKRRVPCLDNGTQAQGLGKVFDARVNNT